MDLRIVVCHALTRLASQSRRVANASSGQVGFADPSTAVAASFEEGANDGGEEEQMPEDFTPDMAAK